MDSKNAFVFIEILVLMIASCATWTAESKPLMGDAARLRRETPKDDTDGSVAAAAADVMRHKRTILKDTDGGLKYMTNLFNESKSPPPQANTIRSLPYKEVLVPNCGQYTFSLPGVNTSDEYIVEADLHFYLDTYTLLSSQDYIVSIGTELPNGEHFNLTRYITLESKEHKISNTKKYYTFPVYELVDRLLKSSVEGGFATLTLTFYQDVVNYHNGTALPCSSFRFIYEDTTPDNIPLLIVKSFDSKLDTIDLDDLFNSSMTLEQPSSPPLDADDVLNQRRKRDASTTISSGDRDAHHKSKRQTGTPTPFCQVHPFVVNTDTLLPVFGFTGSTLVTPSSFGAGICGGGCQSRIPHGATNHAIFTYFVLEYDMHSGYQSPEHSPESATDSYCVPIKFDPLQVMLKSADGELKITWINNMKVTDCSCINYVKYM